MLQPHHANGSTATLPAEWSAWGPSLRSLSLTGGAFSGQLPATWSNWTSLTLLRLKGLGPNISGSLPAAWSNGSAFPGLRGVELSGMPSLSAPWPAVRGWLDAKGVQLQLLALSGLGGMANTTLDAALPSVYKNLSALVLSGLGLSGPMPDWSGLPAGKLVLLDLSNNVLSGTLPAWAVGVMGPLLLPQPGMAPPPGNQTIGNQTLGNQTLGNQTLGNQTLGNQTFGTQTAVSFMPMLGPEVLLMDLVKPVGPVSPGQPLPWQLDFSGNNFTGAHSCMHCNLNLLQLACHPALLQGFVFAAAFPSRPETPT